MLHAILALLFISLGINLIGASLAGDQPAISSTITTAITASDVTVPVVSVAGFPSAGWLYIRGEALSYTANETPCVTGAFSGQAACFTGVSRGQFESDAIAHPSAVQVYSETAGTLNDLAALEARTSIDDLGDVTTPWGSGWALMRFLGHSVTYDWPMFSGPFGLVRLFGTAINVAIGLFLFLQLGTLLVSTVRTFRP